jgi:hypothetical protein
MRSFLKPTLLLVGLGLTSLCFVPQALAVRAVTPYCAPGLPNSVSPGGAILTSISGFGTATAEFEVLDTPAGQFGLLVTGDLNPGGLPFGCGTLCVGGNRIPYGPFLPVGAQTFVLATINMAISPNNRIQWYYRDPAGVCGTFNLSNALKD